MIITISVPEKLNVCASKANKNRHDPHFSPKVINGKVEPDNKKSVKNNMSEMARKQEAIMYKQILDAKLGHHVQSKK